MTSYSTLSKIKESIDKNDIKEFKSLLKTVSRLSFDIESHIINSNKIDFIEELIVSDKLTPSTYKLLENTCDGRIRRLSEIKKL